jgi:hypothetical protein
LPLPKTGHSTASDLRDHNATSLSIKPDDFDDTPFSPRGGLGKTTRCLAWLDELNTVCLRDLSKYDFHHDFRIFAKSDGTILYKYLFCSALIVW